MREKEDEKIGFLPEYEKENAKIVARNKLWKEEDNSIYAKKYDLFRDYIKAINETKENLMDPNKSDYDPMCEKNYPAFFVNKVLSGSSDTVMLANEMNRNHALKKDMQFQFLLNSIRPKKRYIPFIRPEQTEDIECVKEYYGYSNDKAKSALKILSENDIKYIKEKLFKGGTK